MVGRHAHVLGSCGGERRVKVRGGGGRRNCAAAVSGPSGRRVASLGELQVLLGAGARHALQAKRRRWHAKACARKHSFGSVTSHTPRLLLLLMRLLLRLLLRVLLWLLLRLLG